MSKKFVIVLAVADSHSKADSVSVVLGSYNRLPFLRLAIESVRAQTFPIREIIVVDGGSNDGSLQWLLEQKDVLTIVQHNRGQWNGKPIQRKSWGYFMNLGFRAAKGKWICMISDDCFMHPRAVEEGVLAFRAEIAKQAEATKQIGAVAFFWRNWPTEPKFQIGRTFGGQIFVNHGLFSKDALEAVGYCDEENYQFYHADGDLVLRMVRSGYSVVPSRRSFVEHFADANVQIRTSNLVNQAKDFDTYVKNWKSLDESSGPYEPWIQLDEGAPNFAPKQWRFVYTIQVVSTLLQSILKFRFSEALRQMRFLLSWSERRGL